MKTDQLIEVLATNAGAVETAALSRHLRWAIGIGALGALVLMFVVYGANRALQTLLLLPAFWVKIAFAASVLASSLVVWTRLARPGAPVGASNWMIVVPVIALWMLAILVLSDAEPASRAQLVLGNTWRSCPFNIALLSLPTFIASLWALKQLAPTRLRLAAGVSGLAAGALGALVYAFHCPELAAPFLGVWYVVGILIPTLMGVAIGPRVLRW